ncbi:MAG: AAA family ATPase [Anaerolineae bacterium]
MGFSQDNQPDSSFKHLQLMLMRIDLMIHREVRHWQLANQNAADLLRGQYISDAEVNALLKQPFGMHWRYLINDKEDGTDAYAKAVSSADQKINELLENLPEGDPTPRLLYLAQAFGLSRMELDVLLISLAPSMDLRYERLFGYLLDDATRKRPSVNLILDLLASPGPERLMYLSLFEPDAPLRKFGFVELGAEPGMIDPPMLNRFVRPDPALISWLLGNYQPHEQLADWVSVHHAENLEEDLLLTGSRLQEVAEAEVNRPILVFHGPDDAAKHAAARVFAHQAQQKILRIDIDKLVTVQKLSLQRAVRLALRDALLIDAIPELTGWDVSIKDASIPPHILDELLTFPGMLIIEGKQSWQTREVARHRHLIRLDFPLPNYVHRQALWRHYLAGLDFDAADLIKLASQFTLKTGQILDVVITARDLAATHGRNMSADDLFIAAREHSNPRLAEMARKITPRYSWDDLILPDDQITLLREMVSTVLGRPKVIEEWGVGKKLYSSGVTVLFAGPPGTGKTMAAEVIARELELDLYKIDLSGIVSKYIGETEKNLERIFNEAQTSNAILFFDEADSIFGKRSEVKDAHDRYANIEVSYLLQRMENYDGVTILATNLRANLDEAFMRRLQFALDFPLPEVEDRIRIWETLFPPEVPRAADLELSLLAERFRFSGGNIRNILVGAAYLAANNGQMVTMEHLMHSTRRELQKMGRLVDEQDLELE